MGEIIGIVILYISLYQWACLLMQIAGKPHPCFDLVPWYLWPVKRMNVRLAAQPCPPGGKTDGKKSAWRSRVTLDLQAAEIKVCNPVAVVCSEWRSQPWLIFGASERGEMFYWFSPHRIPFLYLNSKIRVISYIYAKSVYLALLLLLLLLFFTADMGFADYLIHLWSL